jgi:hypothetical protein
VNRDRRPMNPSESPERDPAIAELLDEIRSYLHNVSATTGVQQDIAHAVAEHFAAPYALTLFYEIERLDAALALARAATRGTYASPTCPVSDGHELDA